MGKQEVLSIVISCLFLLLVQPAASTASASTFLYNLQISLARTAAVKAFKPAFLRPFTKRKTSIVSSSSGTEDTIVTFFKPSALRYFAASPTTSTTTCNTTSTSIGSKPRIWSASSSTVIESSFCDFPGIDLQSGLAVTLRLNPFAFTNEETCNAIMGTLVNPWFTHGLFEKEHWIIFGYDSLMSEDLESFLNSRNETSSSSSSSFSSSSSPLELYFKSKQQLDQLHSHGYYHGNLQLRNFLVSTGSTTNEIKLINFQHCSRTDQGGLYSRRAKVIEQQTLVNLFKPHLSESDYEDIFRKF